MPVRPPVATDTSATPVTVLPSAGAVIRSWLLAGGAGGVVVVVVVALVGWPPQTALPGLQVRAPPPGTWPGSDCGKRKKLPGS
jgi:hypothetical protein